MNAAPQLEDRIQRFRDPLLSFLLRRLPRDQAEELAQETWLRVTRAAPVLEDDQAFRAYLFAVARRLIVDRHRRHQARIHLVPLEGGEPHPSGHDPHHDAVANEMVDVVEQALATLKPEIAQVFRWRMTGDLTFRQIAERQGVPLNTALGRHHRATKTIAAALRQAGLMRGEP